MNVELVHGWWVTTDSGGQMGTTDTSGITQKQIENASNVLIYLRNAGWSDSAICGAIGNMQVESWLSPGWIQSNNRYRLPNSAASLSDVPNSVMIDFYKEHYGVSSRAFGVGIAQWDGYTDKALPYGQKLVSYAIRNNADWYDGNIQMSRIEFERNSEEGYQWSPATINGIRWTWANYPTNTQTPEISARIWQVCYEVSSSEALARRQANARYWYDYFQSHSPTPPYNPNLTYILFANRQRKLLKNRKVRT